MYMFAQCYCVCIYALYTFMHNAFLKEMSLTSHVMLVGSHFALSPYIKPCEELVVIVNMSL